VTKYTVAQVGCGGRGHRHIEGFLRNPDRFDLVAICDLDRERLDATADTFAIPRRYTDADAMLGEVKPDVFCFVTQPAARLELVELGVRRGVRAIAFEKPMATSLAEAHAIVSLCDSAGVKAIVSHQQKYGPQWQKAKAVVDSGAIGDVVRIHASARAWLMQLGTHIVDYLMWFNGARRAEWVVGHLHGAEHLADSHPSPDYILGEIAFENGLRAFVESGYLSPQWLGDDRFWTDNRITVYGTHGYAWANTDGGWAAFTKESGGEVIGEQLAQWGEQERELLQAPYLRELADWLDDDARPHSCNAAISYHGLEILTGLCLSALEHRRVDLPVAEIPGETVLERIARELLPR